jgi:uncharacterized protein (TIGR02117 family)
VSVRAAPTWRRKLVVLVWLSAGSLCGCVSPPALPETATPGDSVIYVVARGWHTDIGLPVDEVTGSLASLEPDFPGVRFMVFGFGERNYLMARSAGPGEMLSALFPSKSAILMTALRAPPAEAFADEQVRMLRLTHDQVDRLADLIWGGLEKAADGSAQRLADGPYPGSAFYASNETYDVFYTCNTWTAQLLRKGGLPVNPQGVLFASQVMQQVDQIAAMQARQNR